MLAVLMWAAAAVGGGAEAPRPAYAEGQVWEYRTRSGDEQSRLKIGRIDHWPGREEEPIYHISIAGVSFGPDHANGVIQHVPVSRETLEASTTRLSDANGLEFGNVDEGIAEWRRAEGGVFTISVAEIVEAMAQMLGRAPLPEA